MSFLNTTQKDITKVSYCCIKTLMVYKDVVNKIILVFSKKYLIYFV